MKRTAMLYPIRAAARLTQLSIDILRAWEKRYAAVAPVRKNGRRFYREADIERLTLLRRVLEHGHSIGNAVKLSNSELLPLLTKFSRTGKTTGEAPTERILEAIDRFQYSIADRELGRLASLMSPRDLVHEVALPLLRIAGEEWSEQRMRISQEHMLSQLLGNLLGGIVRIYSPEHPEATILTATLSDDLHEFGILTAAILTAGSGLGVVHLGPNLPAKEVIFAARRSEADVVLLSITRASDRSLREEQLRAIRTSLPEKVEVWVGVNPPQLELRVKGIRVLRSFQELEGELQRIGGRF